MLIKPDAAVTPARPAIAPFIPAVNEGFFDLFHANKTHTIDDTADAACVTRRVLAVNPPALYASL